MVVKNFEIGMKIYNSRWFFEYNLSCEDFAEYLKDWGVNFVISTPRLLPMPDDVKNNKVPAEFLKRFKEYDDLYFREVLRKKKINYWIAATMFFDPEAVKNNNSLIPISDSGEEMKKDDWYIGIPPSVESYNNAKKDAIFKAATKIKPDGIFLTFMRWPGFWESWIPERKRKELSDYSFDNNSLNRFSKETSVKLPNLDIKDLSKWIYANFKKEWIDWKCGIVEGVIKQVKDSIKIIDPEMKIMLNGVPFGEKDFRNAGVELLGQRPETFSPVVDILEIMTYFQILKRPISWIPMVVNELSKRFGKNTYCTIPSIPYYTEGIYVNDNRSKEINTKEFSNAIENVVNSNASGVIFFGAELAEQVFIKKDFDKVNVIKKIKGN